MGEGMTSGAMIFCTIVSGASLWPLPTRGLSLASRLGAVLFTGEGGISLRAGETSFLYDLPEMTPLGYTCGSAFESAGAMPADCPADADEPAGASIPDACCLSGAETSVEPPLLTIKPATATSASTSIALIRVIRFTLVPNLFVMSSPFEDIYARFTTLPIHLPLIRGT